MILDSTYFQGDLYIPNLKIKESSQGVASMLQVVGENNLNWYIDKYEREALINILGKKLYDNFILGLAEDPINKIWVDLKQNLFFEVSEFKTSPIANYVYFFLNRMNQTQTSIQGEVRAEMTHAVIASISDKLVRIWNDMCYQVNIFKISFLFDRWDVYQAYADKKTCLCNSFFRPINKFNL